MGDGLSKSAQPAGQGWLFQNTEILPFEGNVTAIFSHKKSLCYCSQTLKVSVVFPRVEHARSLLWAALSSPPANMFLLLDLLIPQSASDNWVQVVTEKIAFAALFPDNGKNNLSSS